MKEAEHFLRANEMAISRICSLISDVECAELDFPIEVNEAYAIINHRVYPDFLGFLAKHRIMLNFALYL